MVFQYLNRGPGRFPRPGGTSNHYGNRLWHIQNVSREKCGWPPSGTGPGKREWVSHRFHRCNRLGMNRIGETRGSFSPQRNKENREERAEEIYKTVFRNGVRGSRRFRRLFRLNRLGMNRMIRIIGIKGARRSRRLRRYDNRWDCRSKEIRIIRIIRNKKSGSHTDCADFTDVID